MSMGDLSVVIAFRPWVWRWSQAKLIGSAAAFHDGKVSAVRWTAR
jgi:hypothetical protein